MAKIQWLPADVLPNGWWNHIAFFPVLQHPHMKERYLVRGVESYYGKNWDVLMLDTKTQKFTRMSSMSDSRYQTYVELHGEEREKALTLINFNFFL